MDGPSHSMLATKLISAEAYNRMPHIRAPSQMAALHMKAWVRLRALIIQHGLEDQVSVRITRRRWACPDGYVMVYSTQSSGPFPVFTVLCPCPAEEVEGLVCGLYYRAVSDDCMEPYEYTDGPVTNLGHHNAFVREFAKLCYAVGVQDVFALAARPTPQEMSYEVDVPERTTTIILPCDEWSLEVVEDLHQRYDQSWRSWRLWRLPRAWLAQTAQYWAEWMLLGRWVLIRVDGCVLKAVCAWFHNMQTTLN